jgi:tRNA(Ile)-lysidine synthase
MVKLFKSFISNNNLCDKNDTILVTVSGGIDSVVLLDLFFRENYNIALAHCNFKLRNKESDNDELFVKSLCEKYKIKNHFIAFDTKEYATQQGISIEMAARKLRYNWFNKLCNDYNYSKVAVGHHLNDSIETIFINLLRGTGINGITGIAPKNENIIRPLLFATREQIEEYAKLNNLKYRNDSSNKSTVFIRNIIRHKIIPEFKKINPSFEKTMMQNTENLKNASTIFNNHIEKTTRDIVIKNGNQYKISIDKLNNLPEKQTWLFEFLNKFGFSFDNVVNIISKLNTNAGKQFFSNTHQLLIDRDYLLIEEQNKSNRNFIANNISELSELPVNISVSVVEPENFILDKNQLTANIDLDKIKFPVSIRKWQDGDYFYPLGMNKKKKLSDFFIDNKINRFAKDKTWIFSDAENRIFWVGGLRIDNRFKVTDNTKNILILHL